MSTSVFRAVPRETVEKPLWLQSPSVGDAIVTEALTVPLERIKDGSGEARGTGTTEGWISGLSMMRFRDSDFGYGEAGQELKRYPLLSSIVRLKQLEVGKSVRQVMMNRLDPNSGLKKHRDGKPDHLRFHLPIVTNDGVEWWDEWCGQRHMKAFHWYGPINYCGWLHSMSNLGREPRYHLIVDFK